MRAPTRPTSPALWAGLLVAVAVTVAVAAGASRLSSPAAAEQAQGVAFAYRVSEGQCLDELRAWPVIIGWNERQGYLGYTAAHPEVPSWTITFRSDLVRYVPAVQRFVFAHECGHVNSGDLGPTKELAANCWAAMRLTQEGAMSADDWYAVFNSLLVAYPAPMGPYPSGADQIASIQRCIAAASN